MIGKIKNLLKDNLVIVLVLIIPFIAGINLLRPGYFSSHDDVQVMRLYEMEKCLKDGQIPCRLVPDMGAGYGHPLFNYHPVFAYYTGMFFRLFNISFIDTSKLLFFFSLIFSSLFMYILAKEFFGKFGGILAASMYVLAPYHSVDIYVRGALTETWGITFFPLILLVIYKLIKTNEFNYFVLTIFSIFLLVISHNTMPFLFLPVAFIWGLFWVFLEKRWKIIPKLLLCFLWAFSLSAFFLVPSLLEINLAKLQTMATGYYDFRDHFVTLFQLFFNRKWGYGPSILGPNDTMPFQLGWPLWPLALVSGFAAIVIFLQKKFKSQVNNALIFSFILFVFSVFMTHSKSYYVWNLIPGISFVQFSWRFLSLAILAMAILIGGLVQLFKSEKSKAIVSTTIIIITLLLNISYFKPEKYDPDMTDGQKLSGIEWQKQSMTTLNDYVPSSVEFVPKTMAPKEPVIVSGRGIITEYQRRSDFFRFAVETQGEKGVVVEVPIFDFPRWEVFLNTIKTNYMVDPDKGTIFVVVNPDKHTVVTGWFRNTPIRKAANAITLVSLALLIILIILKDKK